MPSELSELSKHKYIINCIFFFKSHLKKCIYILNLKKAYYSIEEVKSVERIIELGM